MDPHDIRAVIDRVGTLRLEVRALRALLDEMDASSETHSARRGLTAAAGDLDGVLEDLGVVLDALENDGG